MEAEYVEVFGTIKATTDQAILFNDGEKESWLPLSQIKDDDGDYDIGEDIEIEIPEWLAYKSGLI